MVSVLAQRGTLECAPEYPRHERDQGHRHVTSRYARRHGFALRSPPTIFRTSQTTSGKYAPEGVEHREFQQGLTYWDYLCGNNKSQSSGEYRLWKSASSQRCDDGGPERTIINQGGRKAAFDPNNTTQRPVGTRRALPKQALIKIEQAYTAFTPPSRY